ncbi:MAG: lytic transglycosylase domain-containing protein [Myxococcota bacterium]
MRLSTKVLAATVALQVAAAVAMAGGMPLRVWLSSRWAEQVLTGEAPNMEPALRADVARLVAEEADANDLDPALVLAVIKVESSFKLDAVSNKGARGLMQMMPHVAREMTAGTATRENLHDPALNIRLGTSLLRSLIDQYKGRLPRALAAYNMGSRRINEALHWYGDLRDTHLKYPRKVMSVAAQFKARYPMVEAPEG